MMYSSAEIPGLCNKFHGFIQYQRPGLIPIYYVPFCAYTPKSWCLHSGKWMNGKEHGDNGERRLANGMRYVGTFMNG